MEPLQPQDQEEPHKTQSEQGHTADGRKTRQQTERWNDSLNISCNQQREETDIRNLRRETGSADSCRKEGRGKKRNESS